VSAWNDFWAKILTVSSTVEVSVDTSLLLDIEDRQEQVHGLSRTLTSYVCLVDLVSSRGCLPENGRMLRIDQYQSR